MTEPDPKPPPNAPYGTYPRKATWPLVLLIIANAAWLGVLVWMVTNYPPR